VCKDWSTAAVMSSLIHWGWRVGYSAGTIEVVRRYCSNCGTRDRVGGISKYLGAGNVAKHESDIL